MTLPEPPVNVRLVVDGEEIPVSCVFCYTDADGINIWEVIVPQGLTGRLEALRAEQIPGRTKLGLPL